MYEGSLSQESDQVKVLDIEVAPRAFKNLAGVETCDDEIWNELHEARILPFHLDWSCSKELSMRGEVPFSIVGMLGEDTELLSEIQNSPPSIQKLLRKFSIWKNNEYASFNFQRKWRYWEVSGFVPVDVAQELYDAPLISSLGIRAGCHAANLSPSERSVQKSIKVLGTRVIESYHIDTQEGLNLFVKILKDRKLC